MENVRTATKERVQCHSVEQTKGRAGDGKSKTNNAIKPGDRVKTGALCHKNLGEILQTC